jgi:hypothetical protein
MIVEIQDTDSVLTETLLVCNNNEINEVSHITFLGLVVDNALSWNFHIDNIINKLTRVCYMIRSVKPYMSSSSLVMVYYSLFHTTLSYGIIVWGQSTTCKLFMLQKRVVWVMTGYGKGSSCRDLFRKFGNLYFQFYYLF